MKLHLPLIGARNNLLVPSLIGMIGVAISSLLFVEFRANVEQEGRLQFERSASEAKHVIEARFAAYIDVIRGLRALFATQDTVSRIQFHEYVASLDLKRRYPGFEVLNYAVHLTAKEKERFEESVRSDTSLNPAGYPGFAVKPAGNRSEYLVLTYLEPMLEVSFGRDILATSPAQAGVERWSRDMGEVAMSGRVIPGLDRRIVGLAMRLPVYRRGMPVADIDQRRAAFVGSVGAGFNVATLMQDVLNEPSARYMRFALHDAGHVNAAAVGAAAEGAGLLFDSKSSTTSSVPAQTYQPDAYFNTVLPMEVGGRKWQIHFSAPKAAIISHTDALLPWSILTGGLLSSVLLGGMVYALMSSRRRAVDIAKTMTKDLRDSKQLLQAIIDNSIAVIYVKDQAGRFLLINHRFEELFHVHRDAMAGKTDYDLFPRETADSFRAFDQQVLASGTALTREEVVTQDDGLHTYLSIKAPLFGEDGHAYAICGISTDITDRKHAEEDLKRHRTHLEDLVKARTAELTVARDKAEVANQAKSAFLASMSHELRTPLNAILGYAQILKRERGLNEGQMTGIQTIQQSGEHLLTLINDVLDLAKIEAGKLELFPQVLNLPAFLRVVNDIIRVKAEEKSLLFLYDAEPNTPVAVCADEKRLRQVLLNLLGNAVKFTDRGQVSLRVRCLSDCDSFARLRFEIQDTGIGIEPGQLSRLFQPFEQVGEGLRHETGTGLGLAISRQLIRLMGSDIHVESKAGAGSLFWFDIVVPVEASLAISPTEQTVIGYQGARRRLLIVDDVVANRAMLADLLGGLGFDTAEAVNGRDGLEKAQSFMPDLIMMDMVMPVMDGLEATRRMRATPRLQAIPVIAVSASATPEDQAASLMAGANVFLPKPIEQVNLLRQIGELLVLHWQIEPPPAPSTQDAMLTVPPQADLEALQRLALAGNMREIREWANALAAGDRRYGPFADRLSSLAATFQSKAILGLVKECLSQTNAIDREGK